VDFDPVVVNAIKAGNPIPEKFAARAAHYRDNPDALGLPEDILRLFPARFVDSALGPIPEGWDVKPIGEMVKCVGGATPSTKNPEFWEGGTNPFLTPRDMASLDAPFVLDTERHITDAGVDRISSKKVPVGTVLLSSRAPIGYLAINKVPVSINQGIIAMVCDGEIPNYYVFFWVKNNMDVIKGKAGGTTFAEISKKNFRPIPALRPSDAILEKFADVSGPIVTRIAEHARSSITLAKVRDTLLSKLISGELRVPDVAKILEDVE
jgi:type I restriction enzyme S subunit